jgi:hypothetical protein
VCERDGVLMACDEVLAKRIGNLLCGVMGGDRMADVGPGQYAVALTEPSETRVGFKGCPMTGTVTVSEDADLAFWIKYCQRFYTCLPAKR